MSRSDLVRKGRGQRGFRLLKKKTEADKGRRRHIEVIQDEETVWELASAIAPRWRALVLTMAYVGFRPGEGYGIRRENLDLDHNLLHVRGAIKEHGKVAPYYDPVTKDGNEWTKVLPEFLVGELREHIERFSIEGEPLIFTTATGRVIRKRTCYRAWKIAATRSGGHPLPRTP